MTQTTAVEFQRKFGEFQHQAQREPVEITRHGKRQAVVLSYAEWERLSHVPSFGRLLMAAPLTAEALPPICKNRTIRRRRSRH